LASFRTSGSWRWPIPRDCTSFFFSEAGVVARHALGRFSFRSSNFLFVSFDNDITPLIFVGLAFSMFLLLLFYAKTDLKIEKPDSFLLESG
jgi:hypothetical protein